MKLPSVNPFRALQKACEDTLMRGIKKVFPKRTVHLILHIPPSHSFGDLTSSICFDLDKLLKEVTKALAETIVVETYLSKQKLVKYVCVAGGGYINFYADYPEFSFLTLESAKILNTSYGYVKTESPQKLIVEHTSVNPAGPIHIGTARNSVIGDTLYHILVARGHAVRTHFYIDDVGRQIAVLAYGYGLFDDPKPHGKVDHWIGLLYAMTNCIVEIQTLKERIANFKKRDKPDKEINVTQAQLDDWISVAAELQNKDQILFDYLLERIKIDETLGDSISNLMRSYERNEAESKKVIRRVVELCLEGFRETYKRAGIKWDSWDWESHFIWNNSVSEIVKKLGKSPYSYWKKGALVVDVDKIANDKGLKNAFGIAKEHEIPPLTIMRSDGTTLYTTRDLAYSLWKLSQADSVINVIGVEQSLAQLQLRIILSLLTTPERVKNITHYAYALVKLPRYKMSKRRGRYITFDKIIAESIHRAREEVEQRSKNLSEDLKITISEAVGIGAVKYALISVSPMKQVIFTWDKVLNFEMNSAPFIQYAHARACNILKKTEKMNEKTNYSCLKEPIEHELVKRIAMFPEVFVEATENLSPYSIAEFANTLAAKFNSFYANVPVLRAETIELRNARLNLVNAVRITIRNALNLLGIDALEQM
ncbi:MAG: arginine--tRNA ligase [Candidatus Bathyarchaeota archaeon]|nr:MAG: arginine--tRNA ligase [Candidatus Bathyarchaeota archaeon]